VLESIAGQLETVRTYILIKDGDETPSTSLPISSEYEEMLEMASDSFDFLILMKTQATTFYTTGLQVRPGSISAIANWCCIRWP
jgi:fatty-acyl-CoA synthase